MKVIDGTRHVRLITALLLVAVFALGTLTGATLVRFTGPGPGPGPRPHHARPVIGPWLMDDLSLSASQRELAEPIFRRHRQGLDALLSESFPKVRELNARIEAELRALLDAEQTRKLDVLRAAAKAAPDEPPPPPDWRRPPPPPGGPGAPPPGLRDRPPGAE